MRYKQEKRKREAKEGCQTKVKDTVKMWFRE
jgi:hypothetical protein